MSRRLLAAGVACALAVVAGSAHADWRRDYGSAQQAMEKGHWAEAEQLMRAAQAEEPEASPRKRMQGTRFELYAPGHYAAVAAWKQGNCARALQYLEDGPTRAIAGQVPALATEQQQLRSACGGASVAAEPAKPPPSSAPAPTTTPPVTAPKPAPPTVAQATPEAKPAVVAEAPKPAPAAPAVAPPATKSAAPPALRAVVRAFLAGDYPTVLRTSDAGIADGRARALLLMVRAAAGYAQADLHGDAAAATRANADVRSARQLARIEPDPYLFSPRVRARIAAVR